MNIRRVNRIDQLAQNVPPARDLWPAIAAAIEDAAPEIVASLRSLLHRVHEGSLAVAPEETVAAARVSWL